MFSAQDGAEGTVPNDFPPVDRGRGLDRLIPTLLDWVQAHSGGINLSAVGHRVVHGGQHCAAPARVTNALLADLAALVPLAPLHQLHNLAAIRSVAALLPDLPQVACFDTSFNQSQSRLAQLCALPRAMVDEGICDTAFTRRESPGIQLSLMSVAAFAGFRETLRKHPKWKPDIEHHGQVDDLWTGFKIL